MTKIHRTNKLSLFSDRILVILVSIVTLLLQIISFATTWDGAKVYLDNIFPYAALFFAIAIQATSYFFGNSLRHKGGVLKLLALFATICCSVYFSYIGIYNSVDSPVSYLQENYARISQDLEQLYEEELLHAQTNARVAVNEASSCILTQYTSLITEKENILTCQTALEESAPEYSTGLRAPRQSTFETYEEYAAAYQAYITSISQSKNTEAEALRLSILHSHGFTSMEDLNICLQENTAALQTLKNTLGISKEEETAVTISTTVNKLLTAINGTSQGSPLAYADCTDFDRLLQAGALCGYPLPNTSLTNALNQYTQFQTQSLLKDYTTLVKSLPEGNVTHANMMDLKASMDSEIIGAILRLNSLLSQEEQLDYTSYQYRLTDLYFIPIQALQKEDTSLTARFSLLFAGLIDILSLLFAISLRRRKPLWKRHTLLFNQLEEYEPLIYASLPSGNGSIQTLQEFLGHFVPSPQTEPEGYMLCGNPDTLRPYNALIALLCQINLAKLLPAGFSEQEGNILLLKSRFVFWANTKIYEEKLHE